MINFTKFFTGSLVIAFAFVMFSFTTANQKKLANVASNAQMLNKPTEQHCFAAEAEGVSFYMIIELEEDGTFEGVVAGSDGENTASLSFTGHIEGESMYIIDEDGDESVWAINDEGIAASDGTQFYEEDCE